MLSEHNSIHRSAAVKSPVTHPILWPWQAERNVAGRPFWSGVYDALSWAFASLAAKAQAPAFWGDEAAAAIVLHVLWLRPQGGAEAAARTADRREGGRPWSGIGAALEVRINVDRLVVA